jgi:hypothetical protein
MLKALHRFTQLLRVHIYVPGCCKYIRMTNGLQPLAALCMDGRFADFAAVCCTLHHSLVLAFCDFGYGAW